MMLGLKLRIFSNSENSPFHFWFQIFIDFETSFLNRKISAIIIFSNYDLRIFTLWWQFPSWPHSPPWSEAPAGSPAPPPRGSGGAGCRRLSTPDMPAAALITSSFHFQASLGTTFLNINCRAMKKCSTHTHHIHLQFFVCFIMKKKIALKFF